VDDVAHLGIKITPGKKPPLSPAQSINASSPEILNYREDDDERVAGKG
jgi:hypothetical protein